MDVRILLRACGFLAVAAATTSLQAQCPDGSVPPCQTAARASAQPARNSVAVLYFDNATRDSSDAYVADGLTEAIIVRLGALERLQVKSRGAVRAVRSQQHATDPAELGNRLRVAYLVSGSVRRASQRLRVTVELVRSANGVQVWSQQFDRPDGDVLALEQDIASSVASAIAGRLLPVEQRVLATRPTRNGDAYNHFLRGHYYLALRTRDGLERAVSSYEAAVRIDPAFFAAQARIGYAYGIALAWEYAINGLPVDSLLARGLAAVDRTLTADSSLAEAWLALGILRIFDRGSSVAGVLAPIDRAVRQDPRSAEAHHLRGWYLASLGQDSLAVTALGRALVLEPERPVTRFYFGILALIDRRFAECIAHADSALALDRAFSQAYDLRARCRAHSGDVAGARVDAGESERLATGGGALAMATLTAAFVDYRAGDTASVRRRLRTVVARRGAQPRAATAYAVASLHAFLGEREQAVTALGAVGSLAGAWRLELRQPEWDILRTYPPFVRLVEDLMPRPR